MGLRVGMWPSLDKWESLVPSASKDWLPTSHQSCGDTVEMKILNFTEFTFSWIRKKGMCRLLIIPKKKKQNKGNRLMWVELNQNFIWRNGKASVVKWYEILGTLSWWQIHTRDFSATWWPQREIPLNQIQGKEPGFLMTSLSSQTGVEKERRKGGKKVIKLCVLETKGKES